MIPQAERGKKEESITVGVKTFSALISRMQLAGRLGMQYGTNRDLYEALGYKSRLAIEDYIVQYDRQDIAKAVIDRPANATWVGDILLWESSNPKDTTLEKSWKKLEKKLSLKDKFNRIDKLSCIGDYAILLFGLDDVSDDDGFKEPVKAGKRELLYLTPFSQKNAKIEKYEENPKSARFGFPLLYKLTVIQDASGNVTKEVLVHYSRVLHIVNDSLESDIYGVSVLRAIFNRLQDLEKIVGGDAEMYWRGARPGYTGKVDPDFQMGAEAEAALQSQIDEYEHKLRRFLINEGIDIKELAQQIADPKNHVDIQIQMISAVTGIPKRILTGSERGELASAQDSSEWKTFIKGRRETHADKHIIRPFVDKCIEFKILPAPKNEEEGYIVKWDDLFSMSEKERADVGRTRATAIREYTANPSAEFIIPVPAFMEFCLGLSDDQIQVILSMAENPVNEEQRNLLKLKQIEEQIGLSNPKTE